VPRSDFVDYVIQDLFSGARGVYARPMFGGYGVYRDETMFAIIADERLYFKADGSNKSSYIKSKSTPLTYQSRGRKIALSYWEVPAGVLEDRDELRRWAEDSYRINAAVKKSAMKKSKTVKKKQGRS